MNIAGIIILTLLIGFLIYLSIKYGVCRKCGRFLEQEYLTIDDEYYEEIAGYFDVEVLFLCCKDKKECLSFREKKK